MDGWDGWDGWDWIGSPGGRGYRAPYGANNIQGPLTSRSQIFISVNFEINL